jgi:hypothetical protein
MRTRGSGGVEEEDVVHSGASHYYCSIGDQSLCVLFLVEVNHGSHAHYIGTGGGAHCQLIEGIDPD